MDKRVLVHILCCNRLLRESVARLLAKKAEFEVVGSDAVGVDSREEIEASGADVVVADSLQAILDGGSCHAKGRAGERALKCVLIAMQDDQRQFLTAIKHGALGYVLQDASAADVVAAIRAVAQGEAVCPPRLARLLFDFVASRTADLPNDRARAQLGLTRREQQLIPLIGQGLTNKEIAAQLNLSEQTVKNHVHRILQKVGADDRLSVSDVFQAITFAS